MITEFWLNATFDRVAAMPFDFRSVFQRALPYSGYLQYYGTDEHRAR